MCRRRTTHGNFFAGEEEISDVSLATFHIFDRENPSLSQDIKEARGGCGRCGGGGGRCAGGGGWGGWPLRRCWRWPLCRCWRWPLCRRPLRRWPLCRRPLRRRPLCRRLRGRDRTRLFGLRRRLLRNLHANGTPTWASGSTSAIRRLVTLDPPPRGFILTIAGGHSDARTR